MPRPDSLERRGVLDSCSGAREDHFRESHRKCLWPHSERARSLRYSGVASRHPSSMTMISTCWPPAILFQLSRHLDRTGRLLNVGMTTESCGTGRGKDFRSGEIQRSAGVRWCGSGRSALRTKCRPCAESSAMRARSDISCDVARIKAPGSWTGTVTTAPQPDQKGSLSHPTVVITGRPWDSAAMTLVRRLVTPSGYGCNMTSHAAM